MTTPLLYTINQAAEILSIGRTSTYELVRSGRLKSVKIGSSRRVTELHLREFVEDLLDDDLVQSPRLGKLD